MFSCFQPTGNTLDIQTVQWESNLAGIGAGMDSFYEYLLKVWLSSSQSIINCF